MHRALDIIFCMTKLTAIIIGTLISFSTLGQEQNDFKIKVRDGNIEEHIFYLLTNDGNLQLDSIELRTINPNWIKAINIVQLVEDSEKDHTTSNFPSTANVYIELKRRYLKKYLNEQAKKNDDI